MACNAGLSSTHYVGTQYVGTQYVGTQYVGTQYVGTQYVERLTQYADHLVTAGREPRAESRGCQGCPGHTRPVARTQGCGPRGQQQPTGLLGAPAAREHVRLGQQHLDENRRLHRESGIGNSALQPTQVLSRFGEGKPPDIGVDSPQRPGHRLVEPTRGDAGPEMPGDLRRGDVGALGPSGEGCADRPVQRRPVRRVDTLGQRLPEQVMRELESLARAVGPPDQARRCRFGSRGLDLGRRTT